MTKTVERLAEQVAALDRALSEGPAAESVEAAVAGTSDATLLELVRIEWEVFLKHGTRTFGRRPARSRPDAPAAGPARPEAFAASRVSWLRPA